MDKKNSSGLLLFLVTMLLVVMISARTPLDADMWWHIRSGEATLSSGSPLLTDIFSFTRQNTEWTNHSWLAQVILAWIYQLAGFSGLALYTSLLAVCAMGLIYLQLDGPPVLKAFLIIFASVACALVWTPRPQMFSLAAFAGLYLLINTYRRNKRAPLWLIPLIFAVWSNLHGGFPIGLVLLAVVLAAEAANRILLFPPDECLSWNEIGRLGLWSLSAVPAVLLNPNGYKSWLVPFQTVGISALQNLIQEWASPDFHILAQQVILWLLFLLVLSFSLVGKRTSMTDVLVPLAFAYMTFLARRNVAAFAMAAVISLSRTLPQAWQTWKARINSEVWIGRLVQSKAAAGLASANRDLGPAVTRVSNLAIVALLAFMAFGRLGIMSLKPVVENSIAENYPTGAVDFLRDRQISGRVFNEYNWGGYLIFTNPDTPVFVDGRTDLFGDEIIGEWQKVVLGEPGWQSILERWDISIVLLQPDRPVLELMKTDDWQTVYEDEKSVLLTRKGSSQISGFIQNE